MEAFTLLKFWKAGGGGATDPFLPSSRAAASSSSSSLSSDEEEEEDNDDFFDLEFAVPDDDDDKNNNDSDPEDDDVAAAEEEEEIEEGEDDRTTVSPSASDPSSGPVPPPPPAHQQLPSLTKFRVFLLGLKKPKLEAQQKQEDDVTSVKFLFSSSRKGTKTTMVSKEGVQRYLKKVKPLYVKVSKLRSSISGAGDGKVVVVEKQVGLGKSRSGSVSSPAAGETVAGGGGAGVVSKRRDDSLLLQQDGIQGAILHCKRSFNASRGIPAAKVIERYGVALGLLSRKLSDCNGRAK